MRLIGTIALLFSLFACNSSRDTTASTTTTAEPTTEATDAATTTPPLDCLTVHAEVLGSLGIDAAAAFGPSGETGLGRLAYFIATADGAVWLTSENPSTDSLGLTLPLNPQARAASEVGVDAAPDAPAFGGIDEHAEGAANALECAKG